MAISFKGDTAAGGSGCHERTPETKLYTQADLDRALAAERRTVAEDCAKLVPVVEGQGEWLKNLLDATRAAIRAQGDK